MLEQTDSWDGAPAKKKIFQSTYHIHRLTLRLKHCLKLASIFVTLNKHIKLNYQCHKTRGQEHGVH